jgi:hypothetical protein
MSRSSCCRPATKAPRDPVARHGLRSPPAGPATGQRLVPSMTTARRFAYQPEGGWLPATLAGVAQHPLPRPAAPPPESSSADRRCPMAPLPHDQDITSWLQLLSAIEDAEAGRETARLTEICLSVYGALAAAQFQITQLRARVHALTAAGPCPHGSPVTAATPRLPRGQVGSASEQAATALVPAEPPNGPPRPGGWPGLRPPGSRGPADRAALRGPRRAPARAARAVTTSTAAGRDPRRGGPSVRVIHVRIPKDRVIPS